uniref:Glycosyltransferase family 1 protein n=1 Tax=candidate division WOR-3 bacterium TaxID=2052148 RepID=A0A7V1EIQ9_UNCW3
MRKNRIYLIGAMRIFFIGSYRHNPITGGHIYNQKVIEALNELGHKVVEINVHHLPFFFRIKFFSFLYCFLMWFKGSSDLILQVVDSSLRYFPFTIFTWYYQIPTALIVHHLKEELPQFNLREYINYQLMRCNLKRATFIIVNSHNTKLNVIHCIGGNNKKIWIVSPGIYTCSNSIKRRLYGTKKNWVFISVGSIIPRKGYDFLIESLKDLNKFQYKCYIVGDIGDKKYYSLLLKKIIKYQLNKNIIFTGYLSQAELEELYENSDLFILPSRHEGYGIVLNEALNHGIPVVATNVGAVPEIIQNNVNGFLVEPDNPANLTKILKKIMESPYTLANLQENIIARSHCKRTWIDMKDELKKVFIDKLNF